MAMITTEVKGELTTKQKQKLKTIEKIITAFYDEKYEKTSRMWGDLKKITKLSSGILSDYVKELVRQNVIKGYVRVYENRLRMFFEYTDNPFVIEGRIPKSDGAIRIRFVKKKGKIVGYERGHMKKGKYSRKEKKYVRYFVKEEKP